jgi:hypothetical protein
MIGYLRLTLHIYNKVQLNFFCVYNTNPPILNYNFIFLHFELLVIQKACIENT